MPKEIESSVSSDASWQGKIQPCCQSGRGISLSPLSIIVTLANRCELMYVVCLHLKYKLLKVPLSKSNPFLIKSIKLFFFFFVWPMQHSDSKYDNVRLGCTCGHIVNF